MTQPAFHEYLSWILDRPYGTNQAELERMQENLSREDYIKWICNKNDFETAQKIAFSHSIGEKPDSIAFLLTTTISIVSAPMKVNIETFTIVILFHRKNTDNFR